MNIPTYVYEKRKIKWESDVQKKLKNEMKDEIALDFIF